MRKLKFFIKKKTGFRLRTILYWVCLCVCVCVFECLCVCVCVYVSECIYVLITLSINIHGRPMNPRYIHNMGWNHSVRPDTSRK